MVMKIITTNRNSSVGHDGCRHYAEVVIETEGGERQYVLERINRLTDEERWPGSTWEYPDGYPIPENWA